MIMIAISMVLRMSTLEIHVDISNHSKKDIRSYPDGISTLSSMKQNTNTDYNENAKSLFEFK